MISLNSADNDLLKPQPAEELEEMICFEENEWSAPISEEDRVRLTKLKAPSWLGIPIPTDVEGNSNPSQDTLQNDSNDEIDLSEDYEWSTPLTDTQIKGIQNIRLPSALRRTHSSSNKVSEISSNSESELEFTNLIKNRKRSRKSSISASDSESLGSSFEVLGHASSSVSSRMSTRSYSSFTNPANPLKILIHFLEHLSSFVLPI